MRVLKAISLVETPDEKDVELLRSYCPICPTLEVDDLALVVIREFAEHQKKAVTMHAGAWS